MIILNYLTRLYSNIKDRNVINTNLRIYSIQRYCVRSFANLVMPIYFWLTKNRKENSLYNCNKKNNIIVSLTSFPARIDKVWMVVETIFRQNVKPNRVVLWLSKEQFNDINSLPKNLLKLRKRGLDIELCEGDLKSHKKYYYAFLKYPNDIIVTVDDDVLYPDYWLEELLDLHRENPNTICCHLAHKILVSSFLIEKYKSWESLTNDTGPSFNIFPIGCGGILYPPRSLHSEVLNYNVFTELCYYADDIWLNLMAQWNNIKAVRSNTDYTFVPIQNFKDITLTRINVDLGLNDRQIIQLREYYTKNFNQDPYENLFINSY